LQITKAELIVLSNYGILVANVLDNIKINRCSNKNNNKYVLVKSFRDKKKINTIFKLLEIVAPMAMLTNLLMVLESKSYSDLLILLDGVFCKNCAGN
jgi:hypothetical protein